MRPATSGGQPPSDAASVQLTAIGPLSGLPLTDHSGLHKVQFTLPLRGNIPVQHRKEDTFTGSMRNLHKNVRKDGAGSSISTRTRKLLDNWLEDPAILRSCLDAIGNKDGTCTGPADHTLDMIRFDLATIMQQMGAEIKISERGPITDAEINSPICGKLLHAWAKLAQDPGADVARWTWEGAPGGNENSFDEWEHLLPRSESGDADPIDSVSS